ncbi:LOW QUALITY PROTEIN: CAPNS1 isoform 14, partial [Pongo abelii]
ILGGVISAISEAAAQYNPEPPPPRTHYSNIEDTTSSVQGSPHAHQALHTPTP